MPIALPLVALVDEQLPQVVRYVVGTADLVGDHHEPDRRLVGIYRPVHGATVRLLGGLQQRVGNAADEALLARRDAQSLDRFTVRLADRAKRNHARTLLGSYRGASADCCGAMRGPGEGVCAP